MEFDLVLPAVFPYRPILAALGMALVCCIGGCCNRLPDGPDKPTFDPEGAGQRAVAEYDANGDGRIDEEEAKSCPALAIAFSRVDKNGDGGITADEIADRVRYFQEAGTTIQSGSTEVTLDGDPLAGATVTFEPESFLGGAFKTCSGETDERGTAYVTGHDAKFPGIYNGFYRVRISKQENGQETIPGKYNTESELGYEATDDIPDVSTVIQFELSSG